MSTENSTTEPVENKTSAGPGPEEKPETWKQKAWDFTKKNWYWIVVPTAAIPIIIIAKKIFKKKK